MGLSYKDSAILLGLLEKHFGKDKAKEFVLDVIRHELGQKPAQETWQRVLEILNVGLEKVKGKP